MLAVAAAAPPAPVEQGGWRTVHVFVGEQDELAAQYAGKPQSQAKQDLVVGALFEGKRDGVFLDLAAHDAVDISNTVYLERHLGWNGICVEANWAYMRGLRHRRCTVINAAVASKTNKSVTFENKGGGGGIVGEDTDNQKATREFATTLSTVSMADMLACANAPKVFDYWSLDVEGAELYILRATPFHEYTFRALTIERPKPAAHQLLVANGYECVGTIGAKWLSSIKRVKDGIMDVLYLHRGSWPQMRRTLTRVARQVPTLELNTSVCGQPLCGLQLCPRKRP